MAIGKVTRNSKKNFLGGGMGVLIPLRAKLMNNSEKNSETEEPNSQLEVQQPTETFKKAIPASDTPNEDE